MRYRAIPALSGIRPLTASAAQGFPVYDDAQSLASTDDKLHVDCDEQCASTCRRDDFLADGRLCRGTSRMPCEEAIYYRPDPGFRGSDRVRVQTYFPPGGLTIVDVIVISVR